jgi:hypothetical protein
MLNPQPSYPKRPDLAPASLAGQRLSRARPLAELTRP